MRFATQMSALALLFTSGLAMPALAATQPTPTPTVNPTTPLPSTFTAGTTYTTRAAFNAAAGAVATSTFEFTPTNTTVPSMPFASGQYTDSTTGATFSLATLPAANYTGPVDLNLLDSTYLPSTGSYIGTHYGSDVLGSNYSDLVVTFNHAVTAFGLDFGAYGQAFVNKSDIFSFTVDGLGTQTANSVPGASTFFGFTAPTAFNSVTIRTSNTSQRIYDNVSISAASVSAVPEPAIWVMMIVGFGFVGATMRSAMRRSNARFDATIAQMTAGAAA